jgi:phage tail-like protein
MPEEAQESQPDQGSTQGQAPGVVDPYRSYNFKLDIKGVTEAHFTECSGMGIKIEAIEYREAGNNQVVRKIPGPVRYGEITLRYGLTDSKQLWDWLMTAAKGKVERRNVSIIMLDSDGNDPAPGLQWNLFEAWPSEWRGARLDTLGREAAIETLTLVYDTLDRG